MSFDTKAFINHRTVVKQKVISFFTKHGYTIVDNTLNNPYGVGLFCFNSTEKYHIVFEHRPQWKENNWPLKFKTVHIPFRKEKFFNTNENVLFMAINNPMTYCVMCFKKSVLESDIIIINTNRGDEESFFDVDISHFKLTKL